MSVRLAALFAVATIAALIVACAPPNQANSARHASGSGSITELRMLDSRSGWAYGSHRVGRTSDGGNTFADTTPPDVAAVFGISSGFFLDRTHAWLVVGSSNGRLARLESTADGGATWTRHSIDPATSGSVDFVDPQHGWMVSSRSAKNGYAAEVTLMRTVDGGATWQVAHRRTEKTTVEPNVQRGDCSWLKHITWLSDRAGVAGVSCPFNTSPTLEITNDAGSHWQSQPLPALPPQPGITLFLDVGEVRVFEDGQSLVPVTRCTGSDGISCYFYSALYSSTDGRTWSVGSFVRTGAGSFAAPDAHHAWLGAPAATGGNVPRLVATSDSGGSWATQELPSFVTPAMHGGWTFQFVSSRDGFLVFTRAMPTLNGNGFQTGFLRTRDGGGSWTAFVPRIVA